MTESLANKIRGKLGYIPAHFKPALENEDILELFWKQTCANFLESPIPEIFRERLVIRLSRYCANAYAIVCHCCNLFALGIDTEKILPLLEQPIPATEEEIKIATVLLLSQPVPLATWPESNRKVENALLKCSEYIFLKPGRASQCQNALRRLLAEPLYIKWTLLLNYISNYFFWIESYPEISHRDDLRSQIYLQRLCEKEPRLASLLYYYIEYGKPVRQSREVIAALKIESAERELQEANERLNLHVENSPMAVVEWDSSFRVTRWGGQAEQIFGWKDREVLGKRPLEWKFVYEEDLAVISSIIEKFQSGKEVRNITTLRSYKKDGSVVYCEWYNSILFDKSRRPISLLSLVQDITDRKQAEKEILQLNTELEQRVAQRTAELNSLIEAIPDLIFVVDPESRITYCNDVFAKAMGFEKKEEIINRSPADFLAQEQAEQFIKQNQEIFQTTQTVHKSETVIFPNGKLYHLDTIRVLLVNDQQQVYAVLGASRDITELVKIRQELQARTIQLEIANHELQSFSYSASHDLRAPLRAIEGFSTALIEDFPESLNEEARDYLKRIHEATKRMNQLIDALLALSRVARTEMMFEHVGLSRIAEEVVAELEQREMQRKVEITIKPDLYVQGDPRLLRIALENLFGNAWKFTSKREVAKIEFGTVTEDDNKVVYFIRDNGAGFDMAYADKLFGEFQRLHSTNEFKGTGIGLATVKRIINRHGGRVWAESEPNIETTFYFTIES